MEGGHVGFGHLEETVVRPGFYIFRIGFGILQGRWGDDGGDLHVICVLRVTVVDVRG